MQRLLVVLLLASSTCGCFLWGEHPTTWEGRYSKATRELANAQDDCQRFYALDDAAKAAFETGRLDDARRYAERAIELAATMRSDWNYGNAIHDGHMVLGRLALKGGDIAAARRELLAAGASPGSPQLDTFGPNMSLAKDLLEHKETDTVVEYFRLCGKFWEMGTDRLRQWTILAKAGEMPDFGANLVY
jgi:hypothetical protein